MKKGYVTPSVEVVEFNYSEQVVVASSTSYVGLYNDADGISKCQLSSNTCATYYVKPDGCKSGWTKG